MVHQQEVLEILRLQIWRIKKLTSILTFSAAVLQPQYFLY